MGAIVESSAAWNEEQFAEHLRDALRNLYDDAYLMQHPFARALFPDLPSEEYALSKALRMWLLDGIEALRPENGTPRGSGAWRPYRILQDRYVESRPTAEVMHRIGLAHSQYHDQHRVALERLACLLRDRISRGSRPAEAPAGSRRSLLRREIRRVRSERSCRETNVASVLEDVLALFDPIVRERGLTLHRDGAALRALPQAAVDVVLLRQLLIQILANALRLSGPGGLAIVSRIECDGIVLEVEGSWRAPGENVIDGPARDIALSLGAELEEGGASRIRIRLPVDQRRVVVLMDNDRDLGALFRRYLTGQRWSLVATQSADEGLSQVERLQPDVVILDVIMPDRDGWDALSQLRDGTRSANMVVIVCSVLEQPELALALGADMFLPKPVDQLSLLRALQQAEEMLCEN